MRLRNDWELPTRGHSYLAHVKALCGRWPHLGFLADFMEVGTSPLRWNSPGRGGYSRDTVKKEQERNERARRTHVCLLRYDKDGTKPMSKEVFKSPHELDNALYNLKTPSEKDISGFNLVVVEDLSRDVIELLGSHFDVDPSFFRQHIANRAWHKVGDWWKEPPNLDVAFSGQNWLSIRYIRARCFPDEESFCRGSSEAADFNVDRRLDRDWNHSNFWDGADGRKEVGIIRSRASLWIQPLHKPDDKAVGILLLDPSITEGHRLWHNYRNWEKPPSMTDPKSYEKSMSCGNPNQETFFEDFIHWACKPKSFEFMPTSDASRAEVGPRPNLDVPLSALLHLICTEWLLVSDYIETRLSQIDWELAKPRDWGDSARVDEVAGRLNFWRRAVPMYRKMLSEALVQVFRETAHLPGLPGPGHMRLRGVLQPLLGTPAVASYRPDFYLVLAAMHEHQARADKLLEITVATVSVEESRNGYRMNKKLSNLTWLATAFLPLSFVATLLSVQEDITALANSLSYWARIAIPLTVFTMLFLAIWDMPVIMRLRQKLEQRSRSNKWIGRETTDTGQWRKSQSI